MDFLLALNIVQKFVLLYTVVAIIARLFGKKFYLIPIIFVISQFKKLNDWLRNQPTGVGEGIGLFIYAVIFIIVVFLVMLLFGYES